MSRLASDLALLAGETKHIKEILSRVTDGRRINASVIAGVVPTAAAANPTMTAPLEVSDGGGLNADYTAGRVQIANVIYSIAAGTVALTNAATNRVFVNVSGAVAANTTGYPRDSIPLARVVTAGGVITTITDDRALLNGTDYEEVGDLAAVAAAAAAGTTAEVASAGHIHAHGSGYAGGHTDVASHGAGSHTDQTRNLWIPASDFTISQGTPTLTIRGANGRYRAWALNTTDDTRLVAEFKVPLDWASGAVTLILHWTNLGAGSGDVVWAVYGILRVDADDMNSTVGESSNSAAYTAPAQDILKVSTTGIALVGVAGSLYRLLVQRNAPHGSDTLGNDAGLIGIEATYTATG